MTEKQPISPLEKYIRESEVIGSLIERSEDNPILEVELIEHLRSLSVDNDLVGVYVSSSLRRRVSGGRSIEISAFYTGSTSPEEIRNLALRNGALEESITVMEEAEEAQNPPHITYETGRDRIVIYLEGEKRKKTGVPTTLTKTRERYTTTQNMAGTSAEEFHNDEMSELYILMRETLRNDEFVGFVEELDEEADTFLDPLNCVSFTPQGMIVRIEYFGQDVQSFVNRTGTPPTQLSIPDRNHRTERTDCDYVCNYDMGGGRTIQLQISLKKIS